ncbi:MAG: D-2-hydroxyacid dehydrogenase [Bacteroidales bacterium]|nr:D-2-hydroxyacid dehydrogenase [Bacteroidales bacterium]
MLNIVFLDAATIGSAVSLEPISRLGNLTCYDNTPSDKVVERIGDNEVVIVNKLQITKEVMDACPNIKLICEAATGTNNIDVAYANAKGIPVKNVAGYSTESVVQITFMHMLSLVGHASAFDNEVKSGAYTASGCFTDVTKPFYELDGKNLGIIGLGNIGGRVASVAKAFGMNVRYFSTSGTNHSSEYPAISLEELLSTSHIVSIHAPLNFRTENMIRYQQLCMMRPDAYLINMGRGGIVNEADLARALDEGKLAGAALDVFTTEPLPADHPFMTMKRKEAIQFTPHIGWASVEARERLVVGIAKNILSL